MREWKKETSWGSNTFDLTNTPIGHSGHFENESHAALNGKWWRQDFLRSPRGRYRIKAPFTGTIAIGFDKDYPRTNSFIWNKTSHVPNNAKLAVSASMALSGGTPDTSTLFQRTHIPKEEIEIELQFNGYLSGIMGFNMGQYSSTRFWKSW